MKQITRKFIFWAPRALCIAFALFVGLFAFDTFTEPMPFWQALGGFLIHLLPVYIIVALLVLAWRWEWIGTAGAIALGVAYIVLTRGEEHWSAYVVLITPLVIIGVLFFIGWRMRTTEHPHDKLENN
ncbi:MAG TPA: hypothetical protein DHV69_08145 [Sphaerochaeta sp.]|nr:MAG: hypothetical protein A2Y31_02825 [Spirochaetes bacterium GWC2_52_13]OHD63818.1 MAG: hypothetical protein A2101_03155 [Spirochaetes bacterium GWF2_52_7]PKL20170.1 MAG: hypothetical protein CVV48_14310 [Spirochaetae bacterium HGW-Spirochaetae-4]HCG64797.1 hypothetical protein [Sphaerochaeta sp.]HCJ95146.1 hypothetical protein [Sphaerochaeta sp.]